MDPRSWTESKMQLALDCEIGLKIEFADRRSLAAFQRWYYKIIKTTPEYRRLSLCGSRNTELEFWIIKDKDLLVKPVAMELSEKSDG